MNTLYYRYIGERAGLAKNYDDRRRLAYWQGRFERELAREFKADKPAAQAAYNEGYAARTRTPPVLKPPSRFTLGQTNPIALSALLNMETPP